MTRRSWAAGALMLVVVCGCSGGQDPSPDEGPTSDSATPSHQILQPGSPGEDNTEVTGDVSVTTPSASAADITFMQEMIHHHAQAIEMVDLTQGRLADAEVTAIASRIRDAQRPEITAMATWLAGQGQAVPAVAGEVGVDLEALGAEVHEDHGGHGDHGGDDHGSGDMPGMATPEQLAALGAATGPEADALFLELMIAHHAGALVMLDEHGPGGSDLLAMEMGDEMAAEQRAEIGRMEDIQERIGND